MLLPRAKQGQRVDIGKTGCGLIFSRPPLGCQSMAVSSQQDRLMEWGPQEALCGAIP